MTLVFDAILLLILAGFVFYGLFFGLVRAIGSLVGLLVGLWAASQYYLLFFNWAQSLFFGHDNLGKIVSFIIIFILVNRLIGFLFILLDKFLRLLSIIPFLKTINRLAGAVFGFLEGGLVLSLLLYVLTHYAWLEHWSGQFLDKSKLAPFLLGFTKVIAPLLPQLLEKITSIV